MKPPSSGRQTPLISRTFVAGLTVVGVAWAAAFVSRPGMDKSIGITAWIATAIIGTATMVSNARSSRSDPPAK